MHPRDWLLTASSLMIPILRFMCWITWSSMVMAPDPNCFCMLFSSGYVSSLAQFSSVTP